eukprot:981960-Rhodomonas_salina.1
MASTSIASHRREQEREHPTLMHTTHGTTHTQAKKTALARVCEYWTWHSKRVGRSGVGDLPGGGLSRYALGTTTLAKSFHTSPAHAPRRCHFATRRRGEEIEKEKEKDNEKEKENKRNLHTTQPAQHTDDTPPRPESQAPCRRLLLVSDRDVSASSDLPRPACHPTVRQPRSHPRPARPPPSPPPASPLCP